MITIVQISNWLDNNINRVLCYYDNNNSCWRNSTLWTIPCWLEFITMTKLSWRMNITAMRVNPSLILPSYQSCISIFYSLSFLPSFSPFLIPFILDFLSYLVTKSTLDGSDSENAQQNRELKNKHLKIEQTPINSTNENTPIEKKAKQPKEKEAEKEEHKDNNNNTNNTNTNTNTNNDNKNENDNHAKDTNGKIETSGKKSKNASFDPNIDKSKDEKASTPSKKKEKTKDQETNNNTLKIIPDDVPSTTTTPAKDKKEPEKEKEKEKEKSKENHHPEEVVKQEKDSGTTTATSTPLSPPHIDADKNLFFDVTTKFNDESVESPDKISATKFLSVSVRDITNILNIRMLSADVF